MDLPEKGLSAEDLATRLMDHRSKDTPFLSGRVLGSMCTAPHPAGIEAFRIFQDTNLGDPLINPGAAELEAEVVRLLATIAGGGPRSGGLFVSGGTEANFVALRLARDTTGRRKVVMPETAHFSFRKAAHAMGMEVETTPLTDGLRADVEALARAVDDETACVVGVAGNTEFGRVDDIHAIAEAGEAHDAWVHVDAAYGGFILPFLREPRPFGLDVPGVDSVTLDPHKMGRAPVPAGGLVVRDADVLATGATETPYVSTSWQAGLLSTRPGAAAAGAWASLHAIGREGYRAQAEGALHLARWLTDQLEAKGIEVIAEPELGIVPIRAQRAHDLRASLAEEGWKVSVTTLREGIRVVCMPHVTSERLSEFLRVFPRVMRRHQEAVA
ncbi:MAG: tyrosine decarboxylase MfnA [Candidatus Thermoplasmatota archaeon]|nr:tyrosine decarboxylase MfnA [Candidatus Thermoplasmatota archaeon]